MTDSRTPPLDRQTALLYTDAATGTLHMRRYRIAIVRGPDAPRDVVVESGTLLVGTHPDNDLALHDATVSRYHLEIQVRGDGLKVADLDSTNGTFHAGTRLGSVVLTGAARLRLGKSTELEVTPADEVVETPLWSGDRFGPAIGVAPPMRALFALLSRVAATETTILLEGETGTGKEILAEAIHHASSRSNGPFTVVDCGAIPHELIASELFGHVRGAFTGATQTKPGLVEAADGGTLFLDEIGELALDLQPQLLRVLEKREVRPVGETRARRVDIRVIAATNRDLRKLVAAGQFREDLFFRLAVVRAVVPPLRERREDVPLLAYHFSERLGRGGFALPEALIRDLQAHDWPGNVRELRNVVEHALSFGGAELPPELGFPRAGAATSAAPPAPERLDGAAPSGGGPDPRVLDLPFKEAKNLLVERFEREYLTHLLSRHHGNISRAAQEAGIDRNYIHRLVKKYGLPVIRGSEE